VISVPGSGLFLALAPMDGITCAAYREIITAHDGDAACGISLCVSEFVRVTTNAVPASVLRRDVPELATGGHTASGVPVAVQLLGGKPEPMAQTAARVVELGAPGVDINFGCPAKTVNNHDGGASLLKTPCRIEAVVAAVRAAVPEHVPVSAKIRLGWSDSTGVEDLARAAEQGGASWLTIHARTRAQQYAPPVDWIAIGRARAAVTMPVVANGDLCTIEDIAKCHEQSGCTAFMIGRAAMGDPWLFRRLRGETLPAFDGPWMRALLHRYVAKLIASGTTDAKALGRIKQWLRLGAPLQRRIADAFAHVKAATNLVDALALLEGWTEPDYSAALGFHTATSSSVLRRSSGTVASSAG
jgi:tRNA-dihydrouridine synthase C